MKLHSVLLVEDNNNDALLVKCTLEDAGIPNPVHTVETAEQAMEYLAGSEKYADRVLYPLPSAVFVDLKLPGKSGHDLLKWMNEKQELRHILKVVLTGSNDPAGRRIAFELGANCYLEKPITKQQLIEPSRSLWMVLTRRGTLVKEAQSVPARIENGLTEGVL
jgi:CheY-like chemotaxis protein